MMKSFQTIFIFFGCMALGITTITMIPKSTVAQGTKDNKKDGSQPDIGISGTVIDQSTQKAIVDVEVYLSNGDTTTTNKEGEFSFLMLKPGTYTLSIDTAGYEDWGKEVTLSKEAKKPKNITIELVPSPETKE